MFFDFNILCMYSVCCLLGVINDNNNNYYLSVCMEDRAKSTVSDGGVLLARKEEIAPTNAMAEYSTPQQIDVKATGSDASEDSESSTITATSHQEHSQRAEAGGCKIQVSRCNEFKNKLFSLDFCNLKHLTEFAYSAVSLDIGEEIWHNLWDDPEFISFVNTCYDHTPAKTNIMSLLNDNDAARVAAPEDVLSKFGITPDDSNSEKQIPTLVNNLSEVKELMRRTVNYDDLLQVLTALVTGNEQLQSEMKAA